MILHLSVFWFGFQIPITVREMLAVVAWPTMATFMKLDDIIEENVIRRSSIQLMRKQRAMSINRGRRRFSLFRRTSVEEGLEE